MSYREQAARIAQAYGLDPEIFVRQIEQESRFNPRAVSPAGAGGIAQIMPGTAAAPGFGIAPISDQDRFNVPVALDFGAQYMRAMLDRYDGDYPRALAAYNAGPGRVDEAGNVPNIPETQNYVSRILGDGVSFGAGDRRLEGGMGGDMLGADQERPRGILESLGIQRRDPNAEGETGMPFFQRGSFKDFMGNLAMAFNELRDEPSQAIPAVVTRNQERRQEQATANRTVAELRRRGRDDLASAVESGSLTARDAMSLAVQSPEQTAAMQNYEYLISQGVAPEEALQQAFNTGTTIQMGEQETAMQRGFGEGIAEETNQIVEAGRTASRALGQIDTLEAALQSAPQGVFGGIAGIANQFGIPISENMSDLQVADAIISQLVPQQRPPGSGVMSDADLELFKRSLPRLANTPEGNRMIVSTMRALAEYDIARGNIAGQLRLGYITPQDANNLYNELPNPVAPFVELQRQSENTDAVDPASATDELERLLGGS